MNRSGAAHRMAPWILATLFVLPTVPMAAQRPASLPYGVNLLKDPGAEVAPRDADDDPWWFAPEHEGQPYRFQRVPYGATDSVFSADWGMTNGHGAHYFEFNATVRRQIPSRAQVIDISAFADSIDKGRVSMRIGAAMASVNSRDHHAWLVVHYMNEKNEELGQLRTQDIKKIAVLDQVWRYFKPTAAGQVPKGTRSLLVQLEMRNDAPDLPGVLALDDLYVKLLPL